MKSFQQYLTETTDTPLYPHVEISNLLGALRLAGIHAGDRDALDPYLASRGMMALHGASKKIQTVLGNYGLLMHTPTRVTRPAQQMIEMSYKLYHQTDETRCIGELRVVGELSPIDKNTMSFRAQLAFPSKDVSAPQQLF